MKKINLEKFGKVADMSVRITGGMIALSGLAGLAGVYSILICDKVGLINTEKNLEFYYNLTSYGFYGGLGALVGGLFLADYSNAIDDLLKPFRVEYTANNNRDNDY